MQDDGVRQTLVFPAKILGWSTFGKRGFPRTVYRETTLRSGAATVGCACAMASERERDAQWASSRDIYY